MSDNSAVLATRETIAPERHADYRAMMALAKELVSTGFLPQAIKTPAQAVAIILTGQELGLPPMKSLRMINVIQGKPCLGAELQLALFKQRGGTARWLESTDQKASIKLVHPNGDVHEETFTIEDATRAGLIAKGGNWKTYPKIMLRWRAASNGLKAIAPDILSGVYDPDEMGAVVDMQTGEIIDMPVLPQPPMTADNSSAPQPLTSSATPPLAPRPATSSGVISEAQAKRLFAIAKSAGWENDEIKRLIESYGHEHTKEILRSEYEEICQHLESGNMREPGAEG